MREVARLALSLSRHPWRNLALEEYLLYQVKPDQALLFLWQNEQTVVIGRNQNPWRECLLERLEEEGGYLARRLSGGGAVYHDGGNLNFSFLMGGRVYDEARQTGVVLRALHSLGLAVCASGRNDLLLEGRKVSGQAFLKGRKASLHHGTLLVAGDLTKLSRYLTVDEAKLAAKGVASVRERVANLAEFLSGLTPQHMAQVLQTEFCREYGDCETQQLSPEAMPELQELVEKHASDAWRLGKTPPFSRVLRQRFAWGGVEIALSLRQGRVSEARIYTDALATDWPSLLEGVLKGKTYSNAALAAAAREAGCAEIAAWLNSIET